MPTITITGDSKHVYNIVKENRIRMKRGLVAISGDIENPKIKKKPTKKEAKPEIKTKEEKGGPNKDKEKSSVKKKSAKKKPSGK